MLLRGRSPRSAACALLLGIYGASGVCVCVCVVTTLSRLGINRVWLPFLLVSAEQGKLIFPCLVTRVRFGRHFLRQPAYAHFPFPRRFPLEPLCAIGLLPSLSGNAIALPMTFITEYPPLQGAFDSCYLMDQINMLPLFSHTHGMFVL